MTAPIDTKIKAQRVGPSPDMLGESPLWDDRRQRLYWVDGVSRMIRFLDPSSGASGQMLMPSMIGSIGLCEDGRLVAGLFDGIYLVDLDADSLAPLYRPAIPSDRVRFNDGKVDRQGRFVCGGMGVFAEPVGELIRVTGDGQAEVLANGIRISNSLCFSPDGRTMYFSDSLDRFIRAYDYDDGELSHPRVFADTQQFNSGPDGATVDAEGHVWVALVNVGKIARFAPSGKLERLVEAPTDMPSCLAFGGPNLDQLYVTSIKDSGSGRAISRHPQGGYLFALDGLGVTGLAEPRMKLGGAAHV
ncbi:SMP-30/gluconolactonase/LRE family protein [Pararhodobacter zhoushanensis]|uniref:SMP-30/gluconolactonase/LRE family protein n=1 Tax=Pararhodobacter zhoushanensis TaxID=2479545 RepID=A0ABT3GU28_9RHOB|nr:SMP-30/gluconolactonase/LRE family protein [Pararhodobacter zhoushanensis]MCW1930999.1 SMP-30/gluconolactonase/LRE family protein [Pararhodobacter zhoushanensis]